MPTVAVFDFLKNQVGTKELSDTVFGLKPKDGLVHEAVVMQQASNRQGSASTLRRGEVSGGGKKPWRQKHTGRARAGSSRSPIWRHGGSVFGPKPRKYGYPMPKRKYREALKSALSAKFAQGEVLVVATLSLERPKTKLFATALDQLGVIGTALVVLGEGHDDLRQAARNLCWVKLVGPHEINVYDVLRFDSILIFEQEVAALEKVWS